MKILLNNKIYQTKTKYLSGLLKELNTPQANVIVTINAQIIEKIKFDETIIEEKDSVELFSFVGGG